MKELRITLLLVLALAAMIWAHGTTQAADVSGAIYRGTLRVVNNSTAANGVSVNFSLSTDDLINLYNVSDNCQNVAILTNGGADARFMPSINASYPWIVYVPTIGATSTLDYTFYAAGPVMSPEIVFFGTMEIDDHGSIELDDNGTVGLTQVYVDTSVSDDIVSKEDAFRITADGSRTIEAVMFSDTSQTDNITPNAAGAATGIASVFGAATHWDAVNDTPGSPDDAATYVHTNNTVEEIDYYNLTLNGLNEQSIITTVNVYYRFRSSTAATNVYLTPRLRLGSDITAGTEKTHTGDTWTTYNETLARPGGGTWAASDLADLQVGIGIKKAPAAASVQCTQVYVAVTYNLTASAAISDIDSEEFDQLKAGINAPFWGFALNNDLVLPVSDNVALNASIFQPEARNSGFTTFDSNAHIGTTGGGATWVEDTGYSFNGTSFITFPHSTSINATGGPLSVEAWLNPDAGMAAPVVIGSKTGPDPYYFYGLRITSNKYKFEVNVDGVVKNTYADSNYTPGTPTHVVGTYDNAILKLYVNSILQSSPTAAAGSTRSGNDVLSLGAWQTSSEYFKGSILEFRVYIGKALTQEEVTRNYNATKLKHTGAGDISHCSTLATVADNANNILVGSDATPYMQSFEIEKDGASACEIIWENNTTFTDLSGNGNDATPTPRTTSSDPDVTAQLITFEPVTQARSTSTILGSAGELVTSAPEEPDKLYIPEEEISLFFAPIINTLLDAGNIPRELFWYTVAFAIIIAGGYFSYKFSKSLLMTAAAMWALMFFSVCANIFGGWVLIYYTCETYGILILSKHYGW